MIELIRGVGSALVALGILAGAFYLAFAFAALVEQWTDSIMANRHYGKPRPEDRVPEPSEVLWRRALDRAMSAQLIGNADQFPRYLRCPFCLPSNVTEYEVREMNDPQPLISLAHHLAMKHAERLNGIKKDGDSLAIKV